MAKKQTQLEKAIASIDERISVLQKAREVLVQEQARAPKRRAKAPADTFDYATADDPRR